MNYTRPSPLTLLLVGTLSGGCGAEEADCKAGYALDGEGRCQLIDEGDQQGTNTAPTAPGVSLTPASPREQGNPLICRVSSESIDIDGDAVAYSIAWTRNDTSTSGDLDSLNPGDTVLGERLTTVFTFI